KRRAPQFWQCRIAGPCRTCGQFGEKPGLRSPTKTEAERRIMSLIPHHFLFRLAYPCSHVAAIPREDDDRLLELPESCRIDNFAALAGRKNFADVRLGWNELGLGVQVQVGGKEQLPQGDAARPRGSDGLTLWIDTRDARTSHRATRYCHQFHFLPT